MDLKAIRFSCDSEHQENGAVNSTEIKKEGINIIVRALFHTVTVDLHSPSISSGSKDSNKIHAVNINVQWNLDIMKGQETYRICSLSLGFVISRLFSIYFTFTGVKKIVRYTEDLVI